MLSRNKSFLAMLLVLVTVLMQESGCQSYQLRSYPVNSSYQERQIARRSQMKEASDDDSSTFPKMASDIFETHSDDVSDRSQLQEEGDSSMSVDETSVLDFPLGHVSQPMKRRKGPTLSVVNPLEILRQRLMLDLARRKIHENQQQIVANAQFLENIGKRSSSTHLRQRTDNVRGIKYEP